MDYKKLCEFNVAHSVKEFYLVTINKKESIVLNDIFAPENELMFFGMCYIADPETKIPELEDDIFLFLGKYRYIIKSRDIKSIDIVFYSDSGNEYTVKLPKMNEIFSSSREIVSHFRKLINKNEK